MPKPGTRKFWLIESPVFEVHVDAAGQRLWQKLTKREKQIARLAAQTMSDTAIAAALIISEKTVGNHLSNIFTKLEIHSRHEIKYLLQQIEDKT